MAKLTAEVLSDAALKRTAGETIFERGQAYFDWGRVRILEVKDHLALCYVQGSHLYEVRLEVSDKQILLVCDCPYALQGKVCKHHIAAAIAVREHLRDIQPVHWSEKLNRALQASDGSNQRSNPQKYILIFSLQNPYPGQLSAHRITPLKLPVNALPRELRNPVDWPEGTTWEQILEDHPDLALDCRESFNTLNPAGCVNSGHESVVLANLLVERAKSYGYYYNSSISTADELAIISRTGSALFLDDFGNPIEKRLNLHADPGHLFVRVSRKEDGIHLNACIATSEGEIDLADPLLEEDPQLITTYPFWILVHDHLVRIQDDIGLDQLRNWLKNPHHLIPREEEERFLDKYLLRLVKQIPFQGEEINWDTLDVQPTPRLYLTDAKGKLQAQLRFAYGEYEVDYSVDPPAEELQRKPDSWTLIRVVRQPDLEKNFFSKLSSATYRLKRAASPAKSGTFILRARAHPIDFLMYSVPRLVKDGFEIYGEESLKTAHVNRNKPTISFNVSSGIDWFDVQAVVNFGDLQVSMKEVRRALRKKDRYVKLADGSIGEIPEDWLERYKHLFALGEETKEGLRLSTHHLSLIDELIEENGTSQVDEQFKQRRELLNDFAGIPSVELPEGFQGELRPYQKAGYDWLHFLRRYGFGGCLADDMGLGKTVQVLTFLQSLKEGCGTVESHSGHGSSQSSPCKASLVVLPRSLLVNWQREAERFTPKLRILEYFDQDRTNDISEFDQYDIVITTYGIMRRDLPFLRTYRFDTVILDESQAIKNPSSQTSKASRLLNAKHRIVLTGTPVENSTVELWSQFAFLNPGLLGNLEYFKNEFATPIEKKGDERTAQLLRKMIYPFILRRTKGQVAPELPPRTERLLYTDMEPSQRKLYLRTRDLYRGMLMGMLEAEGINASRMKILEGLLRLRQIANHPRLVNETFRGDSGKFELLMETLETLKAEGHKALIFSQFVKMLRLVRNSLDEQKIPYVYLDGSTQNRQERVDRFQNDPDIPFFLISLKAGGVGLNLTAADYVIHIDPWWNPAVEMQAADRTHRIGQDKPVFIYKLITRDSVEEKILQLQERKKDLVDQIITTDSSFYKSLTAEDVSVLFS